MSATERLRELLDERGVEWWSKPRLVVGGVEKGTEFDAADGRWVCAIEALDGTICVSHLTPEQAVTVTLGCEITGETSDGVRELQRLEAENAKLRRAFNETLIRLVAANDVAVSSYMDDEYLELLRELGIEVDG